MIKALLIGVWVAIVALGSVYGAISMSKPGSSDEDVEKAEFYARLERVDSDVISVPVISRGKVHGYFLTQVSFLIEPKDMDVFPYKPQEMINDILITEFIGNNVINFPSLENFDLEAFRKTVGDSLNERVGREVFHDVLIGRLDYLGKQEIRSNIANQNYQMKTGSEEVGEKKKE